ncbi:MAG: hypothetical protein QXR26_08805 [Candidatus Caldarchaeum sp.]
MDLRLDAQTVLAVVWFFIGFGAGVAVIRFWKILLAVVVIAVLLPIVISIAGLRSPLTSEDVVNAFIRGLNMFVSIIASNQFAALGFLLGVVLGVITFVLRSK